MLNKNLLKRCCGGLATLLSCISLNAQTLTIKGSDATNPFYVQNGVELYVQGGVKVISDGGAASSYLQNNGTIKIVAGATPNTSNFDNDVNGLKTYSTGQATGEVIFAADNETQTITGGGSAEFMNLGVNNTSSPTVALQENISVAGSLNIGGLIKLQSNNLTLLSTGSLAGSPFSITNMVQADGSGQYIQGIGVVNSSATFAFPVGDAGPNYVPVNLTFSSNSAPGTVGINVTNATHSSNNVPAAPYVSLNRYWTFSNSLSAYFYTGSFSYPTSSLSNVSRESALKLSQWTGSAWTEFAGSSAGSNLLTESVSLTEASAPLNGAFTGRTLCGGVNAPVNGGDVTACASALPGTISATSSGNVVDWYDAASGGTLLSSGSNTYPAPAAGIYYAETRVVISGCVSTTRTAITLNVNPNPTVFDVTGGSCVPVTVGLEDTELGSNFEYALWRNPGSDLVTTITGTGNAITFPNQSITGVYTVIATNTTTTCASDMNGAFTVDICTSEWTGATSSDWFENSNWDPEAVPNSCSASVIIPFTGITNFPVISYAPSPMAHANDVNIGNVDIASGASITLEGLNLKVCGDWIAGTGANATVATVGTGTVYLNKTNGGQTVSGNTSFDLLQINNNSVTGSPDVNVLSGANVLINTGMHLQSGELNINSNATLRLLSTSATHSTYIDDFTGGFSGLITGTIHADRFVPKPGRNQHFISSPILDAPLSQIGASGPDNSYVNPTPDCSKLQSAQGSPYGSVFVYDDMRSPAKTCAMANWKVQSSGTMVNAKGYSAYLTGNSILTISGTANTGNIDVTSVNSSNAYVNIAPLSEPIESGWNLVGNPYPSTIVLSNVSPTFRHSGFDNQIQVWKTSGPFSGSWQQLDMSSVGGATIAPFQAFMVHRNSAGPATFHFYQDERSRGTNTEFYRTDAKSSLTLEVDFNGSKDVTTIEFDSDATNGFDSQFDANKPGGDVNRPTLYTHLSANMWYATNTLPSLQQATAVPTGLAGLFSGSLTITAQGLSTFDPTTYIFLEDKKMSVWHNLRNGAYTFTKTSTEDQDRFVVHFTPAAEILITDANCSSSGMINIEQPGSASWNYKIEDQNNVAISSGVLTSANTVGVNVTAGIYTLTLSDNNGYTIIKNIQVNGVQPIVAIFTSSANTAQTSEDISFSSATAASLYVWDFGDGNTSTQAVATHQFQSEGVYQVKLTLTNVEGCQSATTQTITITSRSTTGINEFHKKTLNIWSHDNRIYVDFSKQKNVEAEIELYNVIGQVISKEKFGRSTIYSKEIPNLEAAYIVVRVNNDDKITTRKVFIGKAE